MNIKEELHTMSLAIKLMSSHRCSPYKQKEAFESLLKLIVKLNDRINFLEERINKYEST